ncbi:phosphatase PAP2 family protein [Paraburkholderia ginsengiterrae]|nr:phosphatase PAP2 family protein [Paraburkholderia ginsengiterrae]
MQKKTGGHMPKHIRALYGAAWLFIALMLLVDCIWALRIGFRLDRGSVVQTLVLVAGIAAITGLLSVIARVPYKNAARARFYQNVFAIFIWITALIAFTKVCIVFQYLGVTTNYPLATHTFIAIDSAFGFHWLETYRWVQSHPWIHTALAIAYMSGAWQLFAIPIILAATRNAEDYAEFVVQFMVSATLVILIAMPFPAESAYVHFAIHDRDTASTVSDFALFRDGHAHALHLATVQGLVSFPSLHTILALCFAYTLRHVRIVFPLAVVLNALMIVSTLTQGGHYLADVLSGLVAGALVIWVVRRVLVRAAQPLDRPVASVWAP